MTAPLLPVSLPAIHDVAYANQRERLNNALEREGHMSRGPAPEWWGIVRFAQDTAWDKVSGSKSNVTSRLVARHPMASAHVAAEIRRWASTLSKHI